MSAGALQHHVLDAVHEGLAVSGEQLYAVLGGLVGAEQAVIFIEAASVHGLGENLVQADHLLRAGCQQAAFVSGAGMDVTADHLIGVIKDAAAVVGQDDLHLGALGGNQLLVVFHVVHSGEGVFGVAEQLAVFLLGQHVGPGIHALGVQLVLVDQVVADLIGREGEHEYHFLHALGDAL